MKLELNKYYLVPYGECDYGHIIKVVEVDSCVGVWIDLVASCLTGFIKFKMTFNHNYNEIKEESVRKEIIRLLIKDPESKLNPKYKELLNG